MANSHCSTNVTFLCSWGCPVLWFLFSGRRAVADRGDFSPVRVPLGCRSHPLGVLLAIRARKFRRTGNTGCREAPPPRRKRGPRGPSAVEDGLTVARLKRNFSGFAEQKQTEIPAGDRNKPRAPRLKREIRLNYVSCSNRISQGARSMTVGPEQGAEHFLGVIRTAVVVEASSSFRVPSGTSPGRQSGGHCAIQKSLLLL